MIVRKILGALVFAIALVTVAAACGGGSDNNELIDILVESGAPRDEAECVAGELDGVDADALRALALDESADITDIDEDLFAAFFQAAITCGVS